MLREVPLRRFEFVDLPNRETIDRYCKRYDDSLEDFLKDAGVSQDHFATAAKTVLAEADEFAPERFFLEALLASTDFGYFKTLMISECMSSTPPPSHK